MTRRRSRRSAVRMTPAQRWQVISLTRGAYAAKLMPIDDSRGVALTVWSNSTSLRQGLPCRWKIGPRGKLELT